MPLIKRYSNRKLYDTAAKRYISLRDVALLIRDGEEVQVIDFDSGDDMTALVLSQIIFEQEKRQGGSLPKSVLAGLVRAVMSDREHATDRFLQRMLAAGDMAQRADLQALSQQIDALSDRVDDLVTLQRNSNIPVAGYPEQTESEV
jgi:polyhydroxyalkanoate synthesis repressor PhaR